MKVKIRKEHFNIIVDASRFIEGGLRSRERHGKIMKMCKDEGFLRSDGSFKDWSEL